MHLSIDRRRFLTCLSGGAAYFALPQGVSAQEDKINKKTYTYKKVGPCEIKADVYESPGEKSRPAVVWIHGGALLDAAENLRSWIKSIWQFTKGSCWLFLVNLGRVSRPYCVVSPVLPSRLPAGYCVTEDR